MENIEIVKILEIISAFILALSKIFYPFLFITLGYWIRGKIITKSQEKAELKTQKRESLKKLLDAHSDLLLGKQFEGEDLIQKFSDMGKDFLLWASDAMLAEYGIYLKKRFKDHEIEEFELNFAKIILEYRKEIGYKNKHNKITPEQIVLLFRSGYKKPI